LLHSLRTFEEGVLPGTFFCVVTGTKGSLLTTLLEADTVVGEVHGCTAQSE
jgi:hypothetical protein